MSTTLNFDATAAAATDAIYATPDVAATRLAVFRAANPRVGESVLDVGCGPGYLLRELGAAVGEHGRAVGIDISDPMLAIAQQRCAAIGSVVTEKTDALKIPGAGGTFDLACVLQVYGYVRELDDALIELYRALSPGGRMSSVKRTGAHSSRGSGLRLRGRSRHAGSSPNGCGGSAC
jgi:arsenite methyltransferase